MFNFLKKYSEEEEEFKKLKVWVGDLDQVITDLEKKISLLEHKIKLQDEIILKVEEKALESQRVYRRKLKSLVEDEKNEEETQDINNPFSPFS